MKIFCCRFLLKDDYCTCVKISSKEMTEKLAWEWADKQVEKNKEYLAIDDVYEVNE